MPNLILDVVLISDLTISVCNKKDEMDISCEQGG